MINTNESSWFICQKCKNKIPLITQFFSEDTETLQIEVRCSCQKNLPYYVKLDEYNKTKSTPENIKEILFIDYIENGLESNDKNLYCENCEKVITEESMLQKHKDHKIINLSEEDQKIDIEKIEQNFEKVKNIFQTNYINIKNNQIKYINDEIEKLKNIKDKIEEAYKKNQEINNELIKYIDTIINNYKDSKKLDNKIINYSILSNLNNNTEFNMNEFEASDRNVIETSEKLCSFFYNNYIIRRKFNNLLVDQKIKQELCVNIICKIAKDCFAVGEGGKNKDFYGIFIYKREKSSGEYKLYKSIEKAHLGEITTLCPITLIYSDYLLSGDAGDKLINIWDMKKKFRKYMYLVGHKRRIVSIISLNQLDEYKNWIASCSTGLNIKLWDLSEMKNPIQFTASPNTPKLKTMDSPSFQKGIRGPEITYSIKAHLKSLKCLFQMRDGTMVSSANDKKLKFWDISKKACIKSIDNVCTTTNQSICELDNKRLIVGCFGSIKIINVNKSIIETELNEHEVWVNCLCLTRDGLLFSGDSEGLLILWDISGEGKKISSFKKDIALKSIDILNENKIIIGLLDSTIEIVKYK